MIKFKTFLTEGRDPFHNRSMGIMSAERGDLSPEVNAHRTRSLHSDLRAAGHKVIPVTGAYVENMGTPEARETHERSFIVMHHKPGDDNGAVKKTLIHMGKKYGQDSILHKPHNSDVASLHGTNKAFPGLGQVHPVGKYRPRKNDQMFTRMQNGREFTFGEALNEDANDHSLTDGGKKMLQYSHEYTDTVGMPHMQPSMQTSSEAKQKPIAHAFHQLASGDPEYKQHVFKAYQDKHPDMVKQAGAHDYDSLAHAAYHAFGNETSKQYDTLSKHIKFDYHGGDKDYANSDAMRHDLHNNNHMDVFNGGESHEHPALSTRDPKTGLNGNEKFRAVHDAFGHGILKNGFGPKGEETAWHVHSQTFSPLAKAAMSTETRGQNSWVNYSGVNKGRDPKQTIFAKQKVGLLPPEMNRPDYNGEVPHYLKKHMNTPITESNLSVSQVRESEKMKVRPEHEEENHFVSPTIDKKANELHEKLSLNYNHSKSPDDVKNIHEYSRMSRDVNHYLWQKDKFKDGWDNEPKHDEKIEHFDKIMNKHTTPEDMNVYSGTRHDPRGHDTLRHPAYLSASLHPEKAHGFSIMHKTYNHEKKYYESHVLNIHVPKGSHGTYIGDVSKFPKEKEFVLPRNPKLKYKKTDSTKYGSSVLHEHHMDLET
jgi:ADP-ribosyltransferase exoenzyme